MHLEGSPFTTRFHRSSPSKRLKIVVVGDGQSGKTSLLMRFTSGAYPQDYIPTVFETHLTSFATTLSTPRFRHFPFLFYKKRLLPLQLSLWDTAGQEDYDRLRPLSYPDTNIVLLCFAVDSAASLNNIRVRWSPEVNYFCPNAITILVGLKSDKRHLDAIPHAQCVAVAKQIRAACYVECSSKTGQGVVGVFRTAVESFHKT
jgi:small GTP-binding protein